MCLNTARMCRKLHKMLYLWDELQAEVEYVSSGGAYSIISLTFIINSSKELT